MAPPNIVLVSRSEFKAATPLLAVSEQAAAKTVHETATIHSTSSPSSSGLLWLLLLDSPT